MKNYRLLSTIKYVFTLLVLVSVTAACSNSTSGEEEHSDPAGFVLVMNGQDVVTQNPGSTTVSGEFELEPGQETELITMWFLDADGERFQPEEDELSLGYEFEDAGVAEFEQHAEDGKWSFHLHAADTEGITDLRLMLMHNGHSDFTTQDIHVHVEAASN